MIWTNNVIFSTVLNRIGYDLSWKVNKILLKKTLKTFIVYLGLKPAPIDSVLVYC